MLMPDAISLPEEQAARHPDRIEIYFRLHIQVNRKLIPCFRNKYLG